MAVRLRVLNDVGEPSGVSFVLDVAGSYIVGRDVDAHCRIDDPGVSRKHFAIDFDNAGVRARDLGSTNDLRVNGELHGGRQGKQGPGGGLAIVALFDGDCIRIGKTQLEVHMESTLPASKASTGSVPAMVPAPASAPPVAGLDVFCDACGRGVAATSVARLGGQMLCASCRFLVNNPPPPAPGSALPFPSPSPGPGGEFPPRGRADWPAEWTCFATGA